MTTREKIVFFCFIGLFLALASALIYNDYNRGPIKVQITETYSQEYGKLIKAIMAVESSGNPNAYNEAEQSAGILQIRPIMVEDVNRIM